MDTATVMMRPPEASAPPGAPAMQQPRESLTEWLEADGLGGFASGTVCGLRTRKYHALLLVAAKPPDLRTALVNGFDAWVETPDGTWPVSTQMYKGGNISPDGRPHLASFTADPWPTWRFELPDGTVVEQEMLAAGGRAAGTVAVAFRARGRKRGVRLHVRPFLSGRDYHGRHHENPEFRFAPEVSDGRLVFRPYEGLPGVVMRHNGSWKPEPHWYRGFFYAEERARGFDAAEDLAAPGVLSFDLAAGEAAWILEAAPDAGAGAGAGEEDASVRLRRLRTAETKRRREAPSARARAARAYVVPRGGGKTIIAGYPWFTDWGRDTFIAARGLLIATGRLDDARDVLLAWTGHVSQGMLPNRFPDSGGHPEYNSVDASLWFVVAAGEYLDARRARDDAVPAAEERRIREAIDAILDGYAAGTRHGIRADADGLLAAGEAGLQLTWMDARIGDDVVTPRIGKPVEVQALWLNALAVGARWKPERKAAVARGRAAFERKFWREDAGCLFDVADADHRAGAADAAFRPNQILAVGGLPLALLEGARARRVVDAVEARLWTPAGLRSLDPADPGYLGRYEGGPDARDRAYHQGTVWPWLAGPFVEAWVRVRGGTAAARRQARVRWFDPWIRHLDPDGLGHLPEITDGDAPHAPRGCPFQAWSLGEALRLELTVLDRTRAEERT